MSHLPDSRRAVISRRHGQPTAGHTRFVATGDQTSGDFGLFEVELAAGEGGPGPHLHHTFSETFVVLEGKLAVLDGDEWKTADAGDVVYVPREGIHGFRSAGPDIGTRFLILFTPGIAREKYFEGLIALSADRRVPTTAEIDEFAARHDQTNLR